MKLTHHISFRYIGVTAVVLLVSIPIFYFVLQKVMWNNFDEELKYQKKWITETLKTTAPENFVSYNHNIIIRPGSFAFENKKFFTENVYVPDDKESVPYRVLEFNISENGKDYQVRIQKSLVETEDILQAIAGMQFGVLLCLLFALFWMNKKLKKNIWNPFYETLNALEKYQLDSGLPLHLSGNKIKEINDLNGSLNELSKHNLEIFRAQKEFTENASHELQTPLAVLQSNLDLFWQTQPLSQLQTQLLANLTETNQRISRLNKSLLLLSKIENQQFTAKKEVNILLLTKNCIEKNEVVLSQKKIQLNLKSQENRLVFADEMLMEILIGNLISNAIRYTPNGDEINIHLKENTFRIENPSLENKGLDVQKLFVRFQKQNHNNEKSIGIGLEICKKICQQNQWKIQYFYIYNRHRFEVIF